MTTIIRGAEAFLFVLVSAFLAQVTISGQPVDLSTGEGQSRVATAFLAALGIAFRQWSATRDHR